ncbi:MAG: LOG family protein [Myxococcales bacterium]|nr:LOG family protein [Myxococcales bacterium]MCB9579490.1 LOG family protein [Polyangiaceae bacterium]
MKKDLGRLVCTTQETMEVIEDAVDQLWTVVNDLSRIRPEKQEFYRVAIFGSARTQPGAPVYEQVKDLAARLSASGVDIVTGGGPGLMQAANEGENLGDPDNRTRSIGIRIELPFEQGANPFVEKLFTHRTFYSRLAQFMRMSNAFVIMPGGIGTTLETMMVWQLLQVKHVAGVPLVFVGRMWRELLEWAERNMVGAGLANAQDMTIPVCVDDVSGVMDVLRPHIERFKARE